MDFSDILQKLRLGEHEHKAFQSRINRFISALNANLCSLALDADAMLGGSFAKGTMLKGDFDCDVFVRFGPRHRRDRISDLLADALKGLRAVRFHGSRDYFQVKRPGLVYEIVPVLRIKHPREAENVTDMSPMHVEWILTKIKRGPALKEQIMLAKAFCKAQNVYGAESYIGGFSGHVIDILVAYYGSFQSLLKNAATWNRFKVIDIENHGSAKDLNESKISPLIVIDPVDWRRNAAAALSEEKWLLFKQAARAFIEAPSQAFFIRKQPTIKDLRLAAAGNQLIAVKAIPSEGNRDIVGCRLAKAFAYIKNELIRHDFKVLSCGWQWNRAALFWYILPKGLLSAEKVHQGPPLSASSDATRFRKKHPKAYEAHGRLSVSLKREFRDARALVKFLLNEPYVKTRVKKATLAAP